MNGGRRPSGLTAITLAAFVLLACSAVMFVSGLAGRGQKATVAPPLRSITYGIAVMPDGFDPHINSSYELGIAMRSVYDTLLYRDPQTKQIVPGLAQKWAVSADSLTYTFTLRSGVTFHDGEAFDSSAVAATLARIVSTASKSQKALALLGPYDHYKIVDKQTIQIVLKSPYEPFLDALCQVYTGIASPKALKQYDAALYQFHQVGTGPFYMADYVPGDHLTLRRNPNYTWGPSFYVKSGPNSVDEVVFKFFDDPATRAQALQKGDADVMGELSPTDAILFTGNSDIRLYPQAIPGEPLQFLMNTAQAPTDRIEMRKALLLATNRETVVDSVFQQFSPVAYGPLSAVMPYYDPKVKATYVYDPKAALTLLTSLGYADTNGDKVLDQGGQNLHLVMIVPTWGFAPDAADQIVKQWHDLGIETEVHEVPNLVGLEAEVQKGNYNLIAYNDFGLDASLVNALYRSDSPTNWLHYADGDMDSWLTRSVQALESDKETRTNMFAAFQGQVMDQALILPIRDYVNLNGARANISGLSFDAYGWNPLLPNLTLTGVGK